MLEESVHARVAQIRPSYSQTAKASGQMWKSSSLQSTALWLRGVVLQLKALFILWVLKSLWSWCEALASDLEEAWSRASLCLLGRICLVSGGDPPPPQWLCFASAAFILFILLFIAPWQSSWAISGSSLVAVVAVGDDDISGSVDWLDQWSFISINRSSTSIIHLCYTSVRYIYRQETAPSRRCSRPRPSDRPLTGELPRLRPPFTDLLHLIFAVRLTLDLPLSSLLLTNVGLHREKHLKQSDVINWY